MERPLPRGPPHGRPLSWRAGVHTIGTCTQLTQQCVLLPPSHCSCYLGIHAFAQQVNVMSSNCHQSTLVKSPSHTSRKTARTWRRTKLALKCIQKVKLYLHRAVMSRVFSTPAFPAEEQHDIKKTIAAKTGLRPGHRKRN